MGMELKILDIWAMGRWLRLSTLLVFPAADAKRELAWFSLD